MSNSIEARVTEMELRYSEQQDLLDTLSDIIRDQQTTIERLQRELEHLQFMAESQSKGPEKPPHY